MGGDGGGVPVNSICIERATGRGVCARASHAFYRFNGNACQRSGGVKAPRRDDVREKSRERESLAEYREGRRAVFGDIRPRIYDTAVRM